MDLILILKLAGAVAALVAGIWIGLGMPGLNGAPPPSGRGRPIERLNATWMNRVFFKMSARPRRFDAGRLTTPPGKGQKSADVDHEADTPEERIVRLPRR